MHSKQGRDQLHFSFIPLLFRRSFLMFHIVAVESSSPRPSHFAALYPPFCSVLHWPLYALYLYVPKSYFSFSCRMVDCLVKLSLLSEILATIILKYGFGTLQCFVFFLGRMLASFLISLLFIVYHCLLLIFMFNYCKSDFVI